ncbi:MAG: mercury methylation corrinoid protein HgcA [Deltaproteobacteria bacterium]
MSYHVPAGLYAVGSPGADSPVVVTANYKLSYDLVRRALAGRDVWILVLETHGINVWCAAGKGTFGTEEVVRRVEATGLSRIVHHRTLLLPILSAPGVAAHQVRRRTGFSVRYAAVRASDLPACLDNGMRTTPAMRELTFTARERIVLTPMEIVAGMKVSLPILAVLFLAGGFSGGRFSAAAGWVPVAGYLGAFLTGAVGVPLLLPWIPVRSFALKGALLGLPASFLFLWIFGRDWGLLPALAAILLLPAVAAFAALNFTGATPFTSRSGVKKELRYAIPAIGLTGLAGIAAWIAGRFFA